MSSPVPHWTQARWNSFIVSALRSAWRRYPSRCEALRHANRDRKTFWCAGLTGKGHAAPKSLKVGAIRRNNRFVDHISPITGGGDVDWNTRITRMFCSLEGLQVLCKKCHDYKTLLERGLVPEIVAFKKLTAKKQIAKLKKLKLAEGSNAAKRLVTFTEYFNSK